MPLMQYPIVSYGGNFEFVQGAGNRSPPLREGHDGIFNIHQLIPADGTPVYHPSKGRYTHSCLALPARHQDDSL